MTIVAGAANDNRASRYHGCGTLNQPITRSKSSISRGDPCIPKALEQFRGIAHGELKGFAVIPER